MIWIQNVVMEHTDALAARSLTRAFRGAPMAAAGRSEFCGSVVESSGFLLVDYFEI